MPSVCACAIPGPRSTKKVIHRKLLEVSPVLHRSAATLDHMKASDRFYKKLQARQEFIDQKKARDMSRTFL